MAARINGHPLLPPIAELDEAELDKRFRAEAAEISLPGTPDDGLAALAHKQQAIRHLDRTVTVLSAQVVGLNAALTAAKSTHPEHHKAITLSGQHAMLQTRVAQLEADQGQLELAKQRVSFLECENRRLQDLLQKSSEKPLTLSNPELRLELLDTQKTISEMVQSIARLNEQYRKQKALIAQLRGANTALAKQVDQLTGVIQLRHSRQGCVPKCTLL